VRSRVYLHKSAKESMGALRWALRNGRVPREAYLDNGKQFIAKEFKREARSHGIRLIFGRPYHPRGRCKIESYHKVLWSELITQVRFKSLAHFKTELRKFDRRYNCWRKSQALGWKTPAEIYTDKRNFRKAGVKNRP
jgi:transposase InsO family protein